MSATIDPIIYLVPRNRKIAVVTVTIAAAQYAQAQVTGLENVQQVLGAYLQGTGGTFANGILGTYINGNTVGVSLAATVSGGNTITAKVLVQGF